MQLDAKTPDEFLEFLKLDLYQDEIFVFTPKGDVIQLPEGRDADRLRVRRAHRGRLALRRRAKVNGRIAPLSRPAPQLGDRWRSSPPPNARPSRDWLAHVRTGRARHKIRQWLRHEEHASSAKLGQDILERELKRRRLARPDDAALDGAPRSRSTSSDVQHLHRVDRSGRRERARTCSSISSRTSTRRSRRSRRSSSGSWTACAARKGVRIQGVDGLMVRYAQCCQPVPGDPVVGYVTRGRGVSIHRADCPEPAVPRARARAPARDRLAGAADGERFLVRLALEGNDRRGLYADVAAAAGDTGTNIRSHGAQEHRWQGHGLAPGRGREPQPPARSIIKAVRKVKGITDVARRERITQEN